MQAHPQWVAAFQDARQLPRHPHRLHHRLLAAYADEFDMPDLAQPVKNIVETIVVQAEWIAAGYKHVANLRRIFDIRKGQLDIRFPDAAFAGRADHARACAVAAVDRTEVGYQQQHAVGVAVHQAGHRAVPVLVQRVSVLAARGLVLAEHRYHGSAQALGGVMPMQQAGVIGRDADRQGAAVAPDRLDFLVAQIDQAFQLGQRTHAVTILPAPAVPVVDAGRRVVAMQEFRRPCRHAKRGSCRVQADGVELNGGGNTWSGEKLGGRSSMDRRRRRFFRFAKYDFQCSLEPADGRPANENRPGPSGGLREVPVQLAR